MYVNVHQQKQQELKAHQQYNYRALVDFRSHFVLGGSNSGVGIIMTVQRQ